MKLIRLILCTSFILPSLVQSFDIPKVESSEIAYQGYFGVRIDKLQYPNGSNLLYSALEIAKHTAVALAKTKDSKLVINREYRHPTKKWLLSCPGGCLDRGETPTEAAIRELLEETGYGGGKVTYIGSAYPLPGVTEQLVHYVFIEDAELLQQPVREASELIKTELMSEEELMDEIASGACVDGILCTALLLFKGLDR